MIPVLSLLVIINTKQAPQKKKSPRSTEDELTKAPATLPPLLIDKVSRAESLAA